MKTKLLSALCIFIFTVCCFITCSKTTTGPEQMEKPLSKSDKYIGIIETSFTGNDLPGAKILSFSPGEGFRIENVIDNNYYKISILYDLSEITVEKFGEIYNITGSGLTVKVIQYIRNGEPGYAYITEVQGEVSVTQLDAMMLMMGIKGDAECSTDADCETSLPPCPPYSRVCENGKCVYN